MVKFNISQSPDNTQYVYMRPVFRRPIGTGSGRRTRVGLAHFRRLEPGNYKYIYIYYMYINKSYWNALNTHERLSWNSEACAVHRLVEVNVRRVHETRRRGPPP